MTPQGFNGFAANWTQMLFIVFAHGILGFGLVTSFVIIQRTIWEAVGFERLARSFAFLVGPLAILGGRAFDVALPELLLRALSLTNPFLTATVGVALPGGVGALVAWFFIRVLKRGDDDVATRIMILIGTFIMFEFGDVYVAALKIAGAEVGKYLAPNLAFTLALFLFIALNYRGQAASFGIPAASRPEQPVGLAAER